MRKRTTLAAVAAAGLVGGGVLAASLASVTAGGFGVGQAQLEATCLNPQTATVAFDENPYWSQHDWRVNEASLTITDAVNPISCNGKEMHVTTVDANGDQLSYNVLPVVQSGESISMMVPLGSEVLASSITGVGISIRTVDAQAPGGGGGQTQYASKPFIDQFNGSTVTWMATGDSSIVYHVYNYDPAGPTWTLLANVTGATSLDLASLNLADGSYNIRINSTAGDGSDFTDPGVLTFTVSNGVIGA